MARANALTRRTFVAAVPALGLAPQLAALSMVPASSVTKPVLHIAYVGSTAEAKERVAAARCAQGCMKAEAFAASDGRFTIFQTWVSETAATLFNGEGMISEPAFTRLEV